MRGRFRSIILCYHAVSDTWAHALALPAATIERQVSTLLRRGYRPVTASEATEGRARRFHVTFDDAYRSVERILPTLERLGVPVTVFACAGYADEGRALDVPELADDAARLPDELATMNWTSLRGLAERGVEIGSHTVSHPHLTRLGDAELERELTSSRERIEAELGRPCPSLAYPYGEQDERVRTAARRAGYDLAWALPGDRSGADPFALPRVGLYQDEGRLHTAAKLSPRFVGAGERIAAALRR